MISKKDLLEAAKKMDVHKAYRDFSHMFEEFVSHMPDDEPNARPQPEPMLEWEERFENVFQYTDRPMEGEKKLKAFIREEMKKLGNDIKDKIKHAPILGNRIYDGVMCSTINAVNEALKERGVE